MFNRHLGLRLSDEEALLVERLRARLGLTKSGVIKQALQCLADDQPKQVSPAASLYELGKARSGRFGGVARRSWHINSMPGKRVGAKRDA